MVDRMPDVNSLFAGRTVFLTGGSGFVGKKFLTAVPDIKRLYVLVRAAKGKTADERWADINSGVMFNRVRADIGDHVLDKVVPIEGDISMDDMGLNEEDLRRVLEETSVVLHCAATVRFNDTLRNAIELNVKGVQRMIGMCKRMPKLESFVHCSTAYVNVDKEGVIEEKQYPVVCDPYKLIEGQGWMSDEMLDGITEEISKKYFNTYCFTKHVAEELVKIECVDLPTLIFRPSIIAGIWKDGIPGWSDAFQGATACALGFGTGTVPRMPSDPDFPLDVVPVDVVSNMMIVCAAYRLHLTAQKNRSMPVLHCTTSHLNAMKIGTYRDYCGTERRQNELISELKYHRDAIETLRPLCANMTYGFGAESGKSSADKVSAHRRRLTLIDETIKLYMNQIGEDENLSNKTEQFVLNIIH